MFHKNKDAILELSCPNYTVTIGYPETCNITVKREIQNIDLILVTHELMVKWPYMPGNVNVSISVDLSSVYYFYTSSF